MTEYHNKTPAWSIVPKVYRGGPELVYDWAGMIQAAQRVHLWEIGIQVEIARAYKAQHFSGHRTHLGNLGSMVAKNEAGTYSLYIWKEYQS